MAIRTLVVTFLILLACAFVSNADEIFDWTKGFGFDDQSTPEPIDFINTRPNAAVVTSNSYIFENDFSKRPAVLFPWMQRDGLSSRLLTTVIPTGGSISGTIWLNEEYDLTNGFEIRFTIVLSRASANSVGVGFAIGWQGDGPNLIDNKPNKYGILQYRYSAAVSFRFSNQSYPTVSFETGDGSSPPSQPSKGLRYADFSVPLLMRNFTVTYNKLANPPILQVYQGIGDSASYPQSEGVLLLSQRVNLDQYWKFDPQRTGFTGFGSFHTTNTDMTNIIATWGNRFFETDDRLLMKCPGNYTLFLNGDELVHNNYPSELKAFSADTFLEGQILSPGDVIAFNAKTSSLPSGCLVDVRYQYGARINSNGLWKCSSSSSFGWESQSFNDAAWQSAVKVGDNNPDNTTFRHSPNAYENAERIWSNNPSNEVFCRLTVPRYCFDFTNALGQRILYTSSCFQNEICSSTTNLCTCPPPWFGPFCDTLGAPALESVSPLYGSTNGGLVVVVTGSNFSESLDSCAFNGVAYRNLTSWVSFSTIRCTIPPSAQIGNITVGIRRDDGFLTDTRDFTYIAPYTISSISPSSVPRRSSAQGPLVEVTGTGFTSGIPVICLFGNQPPSPATIESSTKVSCRVPSVGTSGQFSFALSNGVENFPFSDIFTIFEVASVFCRDYYTNVDTRNSRISLVDSSERHFPDNLALDSTISVTPGSYISLNVSEIQNQDLCCESKVIGCGAQFAQNVSTIEVTSQLSDLGIVNEIVTSWFDPCKSAPSEFDIFAYVDGQWEFITNVRTETCTSINSDGGSVLLCVSIFEWTFTDAIRIAFDTENLPAESVGAVLYEFAIYGKLQSTPETMQVVNTEWDSVVDVRADDLTLPSIEIEVRNINDQSINVPSSFMISLLLTGNLITPTALSIGNVIRNSLDMIIEGIQLPSLANGLYNITIQAPEVSSIIVQFSVRPGDPTASSLETPVVIIRANEISLIPNVTICLKDGATPPNPAIAVQSYPISVEGGLNLSPDSVYSCSDGSCIGQFPQNIDCVTFTNISFILPSTGLSYLSIRVGSFNSMILTITTLPGFPHKIDMVKVGGVYPTFVVQGETLIGIGVPEFRIFDIANNSISANDDYNVTLTVTPKGSFLPAQSLTGDHVALQNGRAIFNAIRIVAQRGATYVFRFTVQGFPNAFFEMDVYVRTCEEEFTDGASVTSDTGFGCLCREGFGNVNGNCTQCPIDTFKSGTTNGTCSPCEGETSTYNQVGQTSCICKPGLYDQIFYGASTQGCLNCPEGGICNLGRVVGVQPGWWRAPLSAEGRMIEFYECHRGNPSNKEKEASIRACPGSTDSLDTECGRGYAGLRCLTCSEGFGSLGPMCTECPDQSLNYAFVSFCFLVILVVLVFLVVQGKTPKNKESVSSKILLNHLQMLALLSAVATSWSDPFQQLLVVSGIATFVDSRIVTVDCAFQVDYYSRFAAYILIAPITLVVSALVHIVWFPIKAFFIPCFSLGRDDIAEIRRKVTSQFVLSITVTTFITYPSICIKVLEIFDCSLVVDGVEYLNAAPNIQCGTSTYNFWLIFAYITLVLYCVGVPVVGFFMLWKYRNLDNPYVQMVLRFFYDGLKPKRYFWEILILVRKFLIAVAIIIMRASGVLYQIYGFVWIAQAALLLHIIFRPYISARQFRLELWSLLTILITLGVSLYTPTVDQFGPTAYTLSALVFLLNIIVILAFLFFITRGLMRRFLTSTWNSIISKWNSIAPKKLQKGVPNLRKVTNFFELFATSTDEQKDDFYDKLKDWWDTAPNYQRRRIMVCLLGISKGTLFERFSRKGSTLSSSRGSLIFDTPSSRGSFYRGAGSITNFPANGGVSSKGSSGSYSKLVVNKPTNQESEISKVEIPMADIQLAPSDKPFYPAPPPDDEEEESETESSSSEEEEQQEESSSTSGSDSQIEEEPPKVFDN